MSARNWISNARGEWYVLGQSGFVLLVLFAPMVQGRRPSLSPEVAWAPTLIGALLCALGLVFVGVATVSLGSSVSPFPRPKADGQLVSTGLYGIVRHPIYTGLCLLALGYAALWASVPAGAAAVGMFVFLDAKARREERWLAEKFDAYTRYQGRVRKLIPYIY